MYVCGITPYDSTHMGHASTYIAFDTLLRAWRDAGLEVQYVQNVTDIDDPLLERADDTGVDWRELAGTEVRRFASDMQALRVLAPTEYIGVVESVHEVAAQVHRLLESGAAYRLAAPDAADAQASDVYADMSADRRVGTVGHYSPQAMDTYFAERGGDPDRAGKKHPRDPLLWRAARAGEPEFDGGPLGSGRPGWHIECSVIALRYLGMPFHVQGGGTDLIYPHHEMSTSHLRLLTGLADPADTFVHTGLVAFEGHKMSKSRGNLVFVSELLGAGVPPAAIRLAVLAHHYTDDWEYTDEVLATARQRFSRWQRTTAGAVSDGKGAVFDGKGAVSDGEPSPAALSVVEQIRDAIAADLDTRAALAVVDAWADDTEITAPDAALLRDAVDALLGIDLRAAPAESAA